MVKDSSEIADSSSKYFASVGQNLSDNAPEVNGSYTLGHTKTT